MSGQLVALKTCLRHLDVLDVLRICTSSKLLSITSHQEIGSGAERQVAHHLLRNTVAGAAAAAGQDQQAWTMAAVQSERLRSGKATVSKHRSEASTFCSPPEQYNQAVLWLLQAADSRFLGQHNPLAEETVSVLVNMSSPFTTLKVAQQLILAGMRVNYAHLTAAARLGAYGTTVWMQAQRDAGIIADVPAYADELVYGKELAKCQSTNYTSYHCSWGCCPLAAKVPKDLPASDLIDLIYLAISAPACSYGYSLHVLTEASKHPAALLMDASVVLQLVKAALTRDLYEYHTQACGSNADSPSRYTECLWWLPGVMGDNKWRVIMWMPLSELQSHVAADKSLDQVIRQSLPDYSWHWSGL